MSHTLLLNASYEPLRVISWERAVTLFFLGKVEVVDVYSDNEIRSVSLALKMPSVVRLLKYIRMVPRRMPLTRHNLLIRDNHRCQYCSISLTKENFSIDHVVPRSQGGRLSWDNVVACCHNCNRKKGGRTPRQANMALVTEPYEPEWIPLLSLRYRNQLPDAWQLFLPDSEI